MSSGLHSYGQIDQIAGLRGFGRAHLRVRARQVRFCALLWKVPRGSCGVRRYTDAVLGYLRDWSHARVAHEADPKSVIAAVAHVDYLIAWSVRGQQGVRSLNLTGSCSGKGPDAVSLLRGLVSDNPGLADASAESGKPAASYLRAWSQWLLEGDPRGGAQTLLAHVHRHPGDLLAVKRAQLLAFIDGDAGVG